MKLVLLQVEITPKAFANVSPGLERSTTLGVNYTNAC